MFKELRQLWGSSKTLVKPQDSFDEVSDSQPDMQAGRVVKLVILKLN
jgi:hypothetical protein